MFSVPELFQEIRIDRVTFNFWPQYLDVEEQYQSLYIPYRYHNIHIYG